MTPEEKIEFDKCCSDPIYFINKYMYFYKYSKLLADFKLYPFQEELVKTAYSEDRVVVNSSRQMGISTVLTMIALHKMLFNRNYKILHVNVSQIQGIGNLNTLRNTYDRLPEFLKLPVEYNLKLRVKLTNGSSIRVISTIGQLKGEVADEIIVDNAAFVDRGVIEASISKIEANGKLIAASTMYKKGCFLEMYKKTIAGESEYTSLTFPYYIHPKRDRLWRSQMDRYIGADKAIIECDCTHYYDEHMCLKRILED